MNKNNYIVLMSGGVGTRLWPMSRKNKPKQLQKLSGDKSLLQETYLRIKDLVPRSNIFVSLGKDTLNETKRQLKGITDNNYIVEPISKNTAPSIAYVCTKILKNNPEAIIATISSDHIVNKESELQKTIEAAFDFIKENTDYLVTVGIQPDSPHTGYGYIKLANKIKNKEIFEVGEFVEKPDRATAEKYLKTGKYLWNASYFIFRADSMLKMYKEHSPKIYKGITSKETLRKVFNNFDSEPFDTVIAEKVKKIAVIPADLGWSDVGSWSSLHNLLCSGSEKDDVVTRGSHIGVGDKNCLFFAKNKMLATVGLENIIIVDTPDVTFVCHKDKSQEVKKLIEKLKEEGKSKYL